MQRGGSPPPSLCAARRPLLTTRTAAALAACHEATIRRAVAAGELEALRLGEHGHLRITPEALMAWLQPAHDPAERGRAA